MHVSDSIPKKLFAVEPFVWYAVDVAYDVAAGTYTLTVRREGTGAPVVSLRDQPNAARQPGSVLDKFSFVGSPYVDRSNVVYYVDDVVIGTDESVTQLPFVAPGRRKLFVDLFGEYQKRLRERPRCLPVTALEDLGLGAPDLAGVARDALLLVAQRLLSDERFDRSVTESLGDRAREAFAAAAEWKAGCEALDAGDPRAALARFEKASAAEPEARLFSLSAVIALAALRRFPEADERLAALAGDREDARYAVVSAFVGIARGDLDQAEAWLRDPASRVLDREANPLLALFLKRLPPDWRAAFAAASARPIPTASRRRSSPSSITTYSSGRAASTPRATTRCGWTPACAGPASTRPCGASARRTPLSTAATSPRPVSCTRVRSAARPTTAR